MEPFNITKARAGHPVCTRDGREVRILCFDMKNYAPIVALVFNEESGIEEPHAYFENGRTFISENSPGDLMLIKTAHRKTKSKTSSNKIELHDTLKEINNLFDIKDSLENRKDNDIWEQLLANAAGAKYSDYSPEKLVNGKFGKIEYVVDNIIKTEYVLLVNRSDLGSGYFYMLQSKSVACGSFDLLTGKRSESCRVIKIEDNISEIRSLDRYHYLKVQQMLCK